MGWQNAAHIPVECVCSILPFIGLGCQSLCQLRALHRTVLHVENDFLYMWFCVFARKLRACTDMRRIDVFFVGCSIESVHRLDLTDVLCFEMRVSVFRHSVLINQPITMHQLFTVMLCSPRKKVVIYGDNPLLSRAVVPNHCAAE